MAGWCPVGLIPTQSTPKRTAWFLPAFQMEARGALALLVGRFRLALAPRMADRAAVRAAEVMRLTM